MVASNRSTVPGLLHMYCTLADYSYTEWTLTDLMQEVEYLGYYSLAEYSYRVDRPKKTHMVGRD